jgi:hypothetical protein
MKEQQLQVKLQSEWSVSEQGEHGHPEQGSSLAEGVWQ